MALCEELQATGIGNEQKANSDTDMKSMRFVGSYIYISWGKTNKKTFHSTPGRENLLGFAEK